MILGAVRDMYQPPRILLSVHVSTRYLVDPDPSANPNNGGVCSLLAQVRVNFDVMAIPLGVTRWVGLLAFLVCIGSETVTGTAKLDVIDLPMGFYPEGIALGENSTAFVGSLAGDDLHKEGRAAPSVTYTRAVGLEPSVPIDCATPRIRQ